MTNKRWDIWSCYHMIFQKIYCKAFVKTLLTNQKKEFYWVVSLFYLIFYQSTDLHLSYLFICLSTYFLFCPSTNMFSSYLSICLLPTFTCVYSAVPSKGSTQTVKSSIYKSIHSVFILISAWSLIWCWLAVSIR